MGTYYALADGETPEVAVAIREHYLPRGAGMSCRRRMPVLAVAIADKLDTLAGIFADRREADRHAGSVRACGAPRSAC